MNKIAYISTEQAVQIHRKTVENSGGGTIGIIDIKRLEAILENIQNDDYYPEFSDKITHLCYSLCNCHCFVDGNKRIGLYMFFVSLEICGVDYSKLTQDYAVDATLKIASGNLSVDELIEEMGRLF